MLQLYHRRPDADIVRALQPRHISAPFQEGEIILEFFIPATKSGEALQAAELLGIAGMILRVKSLDAGIENEVQRCRRDDTWRAFDVTKVVLTRNGNIVRLLVRGQVKIRHGGEGSILLLNYTKPKKRKLRSVLEDQEDHHTGWEEESGSRRRRRNICRRRPLYVDFSLIAYDKWVVAPPGYEAY